MDEEFGWIKRGKGDRFNDAPSRHELAGTRPDTRLYLVDEG